ncbi:T9SS type B sorting domain-containing protein [uncultured Tenacibaculum sp.]|uniref:T9SS type B sorting domain-containing protein n=1 Tax=uncultured Tenacibaculum sp. TaxID=174713 RepID=UPI0026369415|nr:T9SS type B sorting domain-containing protein [uncultured Tenacibaculum sp.]
MKRIITLLIIVLYALVGFSQEKSSLFEDARVSKRLKESAKKIQKNQEKSTANKLSDTPFNNRLGVGGINVKGNITYVGNNILSIDDNNYSFIGPNDDFNYGGSANTDFKLGYIDIDDVMGIPGNNTTFSSSMSTLNLPSCSRIVYAGLYWAAIYPYDNWNEESYGVNTRDNDFNTMKFKIPGQPYQDITGTIIYDDGEATQKPYVCYRDVTSLVQTLGNPNGDYFGANVKATLGQDSVGQRLGSSAGWVMVVVYENDTESSKNISLFDGFSTIDGVVDTDVTFSGFTTKNLGPVRVQLLTAALEGDKPYTGDSFQILNQSNNYENITTGSNNQTNNFFNSSITKYNNFVNTRAPRSTNTLGFDVDLFNLNNPANSIIANGQTSIEVRFTTAQDAYFPFLNAMTVEIIEPKVQLIKTIEDASGNDIQGTPVGLGSELFYNISFQNVGTDDARNTVITDRLPKNVDLIEVSAPNGTEVTLPDGTTKRFDINLPPGVSITGYKPPSTATDNRAELEISVPDNMVLEGGALYNIRMHVQVVTDCSQLRDVCSNEIANQASASYEGIRGGVIVPNELSYAGIDDCDFGIVGTSNFLVDTSGCSFETTQVMCGSSITLTAGAGFESYEWRDASGTLLGTTTVPSFDVTNEGTYTVNKIASAASGCINAEETIHVVGYNSEPNPLQPFADQVLTCASNGEELAEVYLCGDSGSRTINLPFDTSSATTVQWFKLDESSCNDVTESGCPNVNTGCTWNEIGSGEFSRNFADAGEFRLDVLYDGRCPKSYYFNVYKATLNPTFITQDILCGDNGSITVNNIPAGYQYSLTGPGGYNEPFQNSNVFSNLTAAGNYNLSIRVSSASAASCTYTFPPINIQENDIDIDVITTPMQCFNDSAQIRVQVNNVPGDYTYELLQGGSVVGTEGPTANNDFTFNVTDGGAYTVRVTTPQCSASEIVVINEPDELVFTALKVKDITCEAGSSDGIIQLTASGGTLDTSLGNNYNIAVWTSQGTDLYASVADVPSTAFLTPAANPYTYNVPIGSEGIYRFIVFDDNNCHTISNPIEITVESELVFNHTETNVSCNGLTDGTINVSVDGDNLGYSVEYSLDNNTWNLPNDGYFDGLAAGTYTIYIRASKNSYQCLYEIPNIRITEPEAISGNVIKERDYNCGAGGKVRFENETGGTGAYEYGIALLDSSGNVINIDYYSFDDNGSAEAVFNSLIPGTYRFYIRDANGCVYTVPEEIEIEDSPNAPQLVPNITYNCEGKGTVVLGPPSEIKNNFDYSLDGGTRTNVNYFPNLEPGPHSILVYYKGQDCSTLVEFVIEEGQAFTATATGTNITCNGGTDGTITITAENFGTSFQYSLNGGAWSSAETTSPYTISNLSAGNYSVSVRSNVNSIGDCQVDIPGTIDLTEPTPVTVTATITKEITCDPAAGATILPVGDGGNGAPYTYELFDATTTTSYGNTFTDIAAGDYTVVATDANGCPSEPFPITVNPITTLDFTLSPELCYDGTNGTVTVNVATGNGGYSYSSDGGTTWQTSNVFTNLTDGTYNITVLDSRGCTDTQQTTILPQITATVVPVSATCNPGQLQITPNGGDGSYVFVVEDSLGAQTTYNSSPIAVPAGAYTVYVRDKDGGTDYCEYSETVTVNQIADPTVTVTAVQPSCSGQTGEINVTVANGVADYTVTVEGDLGSTTSQTSSGVNFTFTGLVDDTYTITVTDANNCSASTTQTITAPDPLTGGSAAATDLMCSPSGTVLGTITFTAPSGGTQPYTYFYAVGGSGAYTQAATTTVTNLDPGTYDTRVIDANGCFLDLNQVTIADLPAEPTLASSITYNCDGTGNITITPLDPSYIYTLDGGTPQTGNNVFNNVAVGAHTISVEYGSSCSTEITVNVEPNNQFTAAVTAQTNPRCIGNSDGTITVEGANFTGNLEYSIDGGTTYNPVASNPFTISGLPAGTYNVLVQPQGTTLDCDVPLATVTLADPEPMVLTLELTKELTCAAPIGASIRLSLSGGNGGTTYNYELFDPIGVSLGAPSGLEYNNVLQQPGTYTVIATDAVYGCSVTETITIAPIENVTFNASALCYDGSNGQIEIDVLTGNGNYSYSLDAGTNFIPVTSDPFTISGLSPGNHTVRVQDGKGCFTDVSVTINPQLFATATPTDASCNDGEILINATGGTGAGTYVYSVVNDGSPAGTFDTTNPVTRAAGTYDIYVRDNNGAAPYCEYIIEDVVVGTTPAPQIVVTDNSPRCFGENAVVTVNITDGLAPYTVEISNSGGVLVDSVTTSNTLVNFAGLPSDTYTVTLVDANNCPNPPLTETIIIDTLPEIDATIDEVLPATCVGYVGNESSFGFKYTLPASLTSIAAPYSVEVRDGSGNWVPENGTNEFTSIEPGTVVSPAVRIVNGATQICIKVFDDYEIPYNINSLVLNITYNSGNCQDGMTIEIGVVGGSTDYGFAIDEVPTTVAGWENPDVVGGSTKTYTDLIPGRTYAFYVRDMLTGCIEMETGEYTPPLPQDNVPIVPTVTTQGCGVSSGVITFAVDNSYGNVASGGIGKWYLYEVGTPISNPTITNSLESGAIPAGATFDITTTVPLGAGTYYLIIEDDTSFPTCKWGSADVEIKDGEPLTGTLNVIDNITCSANGVLSIDSIGGGFPGYTYNLISASNTTLTPTTITGTTFEVAYGDLVDPTLSVDVTIEVVDAKGCTLTLTETLTVSQPPVINLDNVISCNVNKSITVSTSLGLAPYRYSINGGSFSAPTSSAYTFNGLTPGSYDIVVRDTNGCTDTLNGVIVHPNVDFSLTPVSNASCVPGNDGEVQINVTLGTGGDYSYSVDGGAVNTISSPATTVNVGSLAPGVHTVTVTDVTSGCSQTKQFEIQDPVRPNFTAQVGNSLCFGDNSGTITLLPVINGSEPVSYSILPLPTNPEYSFNGTDTFSGLPPNTYSVTGTAANGCTFTVSNIIVEEYLEIIPATPVVDEFGCSSGNTPDVATVTVPSVAGGSGKYIRYVFTYAPADGTGPITVDTTNASFSTTNTSGGPVDITVYDDKGCSGSVSTSISAFEAMTNLSVSQVPGTAITCTTLESIEVKVSPDITNVTYTIVETGQSQTIADPTSSATFTGLDTGSYTITATHPTTGCILETYYTVAPAPVFDLLITDVQNESCRENNDGSVLLSFSPSTPYTGQYDYVVYDASDDSVFDTASGQTLDSPINNLNADPGTSRTYYVVVTMTNSPNCIVRSPNFTIYQPAEPLQVTADDVSVTCNNGSDATITASATGGWGNYTYQLELNSTPYVAYGGFTYSSNNIFEGVPPGDYRVRVRDGNNCSRSTPVTVNNPLPVTFTIAENDNVCDPSTGGSITVNANGGTNTYKYTISGTLGYSNTQTLNAASYTFSNLPADTYTISVADTNGCTAPDQTATINPLVNFSLVETKKVDCSATPDGIITVDLVNWTSGVSNYEYDVVGSVDGTLVTGVTVISDPFIVTIPSTRTTPQTYTVTVRDTGATPVCDVSKTIEIQPEIRPVFTATATVDNICFGTSTGEVTVSATNNGILPLSYEINNASGTNPYNATLPAGDTVFTNLPAGDYIVTAVGTNGCATGVPVTINQNDEINVTNAINVTQFACTTANITNNATVTVDPNAITGGTGNYTRVLFVYDNNTPGDASDDITQEGGSFNFSVSNVAGGSVEVTVFDSSGCSDTETVIINPFTAMTDATINVTKAIDCATGEDITVKVNPDIAGAQYTITGANTGYTDTVTPANATDVAVFTNLAADNYTIAILNPATGCILEAYHTVAPAPVFDVLATPTRACFGGTGSVTIDFGPQTPYPDVYDYEVFTAGGASTGITGPGTGGTPTIIGNLNPGTYYVVVNMPNTPFCTSQTTNFEIVQPTADLTLNGAPTYINCNVSTSGEILLTAAGGWNGYQYELINNATPATPIQNFSTNRRITGLAAGSYTATVQDANGCLATFDFTLNDPQPMNAVVAVIENDCEGEYTASIEVTNVIGGQIQDTTISYTYILTYPNGTQVEQSSNIFTNLPAGTGYQVTVRDNKYNCQFTDTRDIIDPSEVVASANITSDITCNNPQAIVEVSAIGGTGVHEFSDNGVTYSPVNIFSVGAGTHTFYVRDEHNCVDEVVVTVAAYEDLVPTLNVESGFVTCFGDANGVLSANVTGGFGNYEYQLLDGSDTPVDGTWQTSNMFGGLDIGMYKIRVRSTNRFGEVCIADTTPHTIEQPTPLVIDEDHTDVTCFGGNDGTITVLASGGNLTGYEYNISTDPTNKFVTNNVFRNLTAGIYTITVKDKLGCIEAIDIEIEQPDEFTATLVGVTEQVCSTDPTPTITLDVQGGTTPYYVSINNVELPNAYTTNTIVLGAAENIQGGMSYYITVRDEAGCNPATPITLTTQEPVDLQLTVDFAYTCEVGNVIKAIVDDKYKNSMSYTLYDGNGNPIATNNEGEFFDTPAGVGYYVAATHTTTGCNESSMSTPISIEDIQPLTMTIDDSVKNTLIANADFGLPPYEYSVDGGDFGFDNEFLILQTKDYTITVRDARGCEVTLTVRGEYISIFVPNLFSPDGDGDNDYWYPREVEDYHDIKVFIYDRYARKIINFQGIQQGWDGTYDGRPLPSGDYWYTIYFKELSGQEKKIMGHFTLYR